MVDTQKAYFTTGDLAALAGCSMAYIRMCLADRSLQGEKAGRDWIIRRAEARRWLELRGKRLE